MELLGIQFRWPFARAANNSTEAAVRTADISGSSYFGILGSSTGFSVTPESAMGVATVFACVRVISTTISTLPLTIRKRSEGRIQVATGHPLFEVLGGAPNPDMTTVDWIASQQINLCLRSNCYAQVVRTNGKVTEIYPIENSRVERFRDKDLKIKYRITGAPRVFSSDEILDIRTNSANGITGVPITTTVKEAIGLALALQNNAAMFFGNGSKVNGVLTHPQTLTSEAADRLRAYFRNQNTGVNAYGTTLLEEGMKYESVQSNNKDSQFDESRLNQNLEICRIFGVPPHKVGILNSQPRANVEQDNLSFLMDTIRPRCVLVEQAMNTKLLSKEERAEGYFCEFDMDALLRGDLPARVDSYIKGIQYSVWSPNEIRKKFNENPIEGGDEYFIPANLRPLSGANATASTEQLN